MNANFDEKQAFENLRDILNHIYNFANYYYAEMKAAQSACNEKNIQINNLKTQLADEREQAETRLKETIQDKDAELAAQRKKFEDELSAQVETFNAELKNSREHNEKLTTLLQNFYSDLKAKEEELNEKEKTLNEKEQQIQIDSDTLVMASANLDDERMAFYQDKDTYSDTEHIKNTGAGNDPELERLTQENRRLEQELTNNAQKLKEVQAENERLSTISNNADAERKGIDSDAKNTAELIHDNNFDGDLDVALMKNNFDNAPAKNFNDKPADNPSEEKWREKFV